VADKEWPLGAKQREIILSDFDEGSPWGDRR